MQLWKCLYNTIWLAFFACVLIPRWMGAYAGYPVHGLLGLLLVVMTVTNARKLAALPVPARLKRISKVTMGLAVFQLVTGLALGGLLHMAPDLPYVSPILHGAHIVIALAILAQTASVATSYDMWEEKEFQGNDPDA
jgi:chromate transport protein ChrA